MCEQCKTDNSDESSKRPPIWGMTDDFYEIGYTLTSQLNSDEAFEMADWLLKVRNTPKTYV